MLGNLMENKRLFGMICCLQRKLSRQNDINLSEYGISGAGLHALIFVKKSQMRDRQVCQRDIEREVGLRPSSVSTMLANLEKNGLIKRSIDQSDARTKFITLTNQGEDLCEKNKKLMDCCDELVQSALTEEEQILLKNLLSKVLDKIDEKA
jgi:DNA-binding MarR family transcriptional regulator